MKPVTYHPGNTFHRCCILRVCVCSMLSRRSPCHTFFWYHLGQKEFARLGNILFPFRVGLEGIQDDTLHDCLCLSLSKFESNYASVTCLRICIFLLCSYFCNKKRLLDAPNQLHRFFLIINLQRHRLLIQNIYAPTWRRVVGRGVPCTSVG